MLFAAAYFASAGTAIDTTTTPFDAPAATFSFAVKTRPHARHDIERELLHSPQEYLHAYLRSLDAKAERLPERYATLLERALRHYGVEGLERTPALEDALYRLYVSQQRADLANSAILAILDRRL